MIIKPKLFRLLTKVDSRYTLISVVAKRARELTAGAEPMVKPKNGCNVSTAAAELDNGYVTYYKSDV